MEYGDTPRRIPSLRVPALLNEDFSLLKDFGLRSEKRRLEFRASAFNLLNRHRLGGVDTSFDSSTFGFITNPQANNPREFQFGLKVYF